MNLQKRNLAHFGFVRQYSVLYRIFYDSENSVLKKLTFIFAKLSACLSLLCYQTSGTIPLVRFASGESSENV